MGQLPGLQQNAQVGLLDQGLTRPELLLQLKPAREPDREGIYTT